MGAYRFNLPPDERFETYMSAPVAPSVAPSARSRASLRTAHFVRSGLPHRHPLARRCASLELCLSWRSSFICPCAARVALRSLTNWNCLEIQVVVCSVSQESEMLKSQKSTNFLSTSSTLASTLGTITACTLFLCSPVSADPAPAGADPASGAHDSASKESSEKSVNDLTDIQTTGQSTGFSKEEKKVPVTPAANSINKSTAKAVNRISGVKLNAKNLEPPPEQGEIRGFHPIKKLLAPIVRLERNSVQLQQQIMKLEGPIAGLNPPMMGLQKRMTSVEGKMGNMQGKLDGMNESVSKVSDQMNGVRSDLRSMRQQITALQEPIEQLRPPIEKLQKPLVNVAEPLMEVRGELAQMKALLATVLGAILVATIAISIGTPVAAIYVYRNRKKIFPNMSDQELVPKDKDHDRRLTRVS